MRLVQQCLSNRKQRVDNTYSLWKKICYGILHDSILGSLIFSIFLCNWFYLLNGVKVTSYADNTNTLQCWQTRFKRNRALFRISFSIDGGKCYILLAENDAGIVNIDNNSIIFESKKFKTLFWRSHKLPL